MKSQTSVIGALRFLSVGSATLPTAQKQKPAQTSVAGAENQAAIVWQPSFEAAMAQSLVSGKPVMVDFGAAWCGTCKMIEEQTHPDAAVSAESKNFVMVKVDADKRTDLANRYGISCYPQQRGCAPMENLSPESLAPWTRAI